MVFQNKKNLNYELRSLLWIFAKIILKRLKSAIMANEIYNIAVLLFNNTAIFRFFNISHKNEKRMRT
jgi:hypothetical protein